MHYIIMDCITVIMRIYNIILNVYIICVYTHTHYIIYTYIYLEGRREGDVRRESGE